MNHLWWNGLLSTTLILVMISGCAWADRLSLEQKILSQMYENYDRRLPPYGENGTGPVVVEVNTYLRSINDIDDLKMVYSAQLTLRQKWHDYRLRYDAQGLKYITITSPDRMWIPDLFFSNEMKAHIHKILTPNNLIRIFPNGTVLYSTRVSLELSCPMDLRNYPMDRQNCEIRAASYGYTTTDILFLWKEDNPVQVSKTIQMPIFQLKSTTHDYCTSRTSTGEYSCLKVDLQFSRQFTFYLLQAFMPSLMLVLLSWITFWLHPSHSMPIRLGIWVGVLVSMMLLTNFIGERSPKVSYIKGIDVWLGTCIVFIFCVLLEMALVNNAATKAKSLLEEGDKTMGMEDGGAKPNSHRPTNYSATPLRWLNRYSTRAERIDAVSRVLFPAAFGFFNFIFWITYMARS